MHTSLQIYVCICICPYSKVHIYAPTYSLCTYIFVHLYVHVHHDLVIFTCYVNLCMGWRMDIYVVNESILKYKTKTLPDNS